MRGSAGSTGSALPVISDVPPFTMRLMWGADASPAALVFVEFVRATFGAAQLRAA